MTETVNASEARKAWSRLLTSVFKGERRVIVEKSGIPVAAIISPRDLERLTAYEARRDKRFAVLDEMREAFRDVPDEQLEYEIDSAIQAARQELREERQVARGP